MYYIDEMCRFIILTKCVGELSRRNMSTDCVDENMTMNYHDRMCQRTISTKMCRRTISTNMPIKCVLQQSRRNVSTNYLDEMCRRTILTKYFDKLSWRNVSTNYLENIPKTCVYQQSRRAVSRTCVDEICRWNIEIRGGSVHTLSDYWRDGLQGVITNMSSVWRAPRGYYQNESVSSGQLAPTRKHDKTGIVAFVVCGDGVY